MLNLVSCKEDNKTVKDVMDSKISYLYKTMDSEQLMSLDYDKVLSLFSDDEKEVLATKHWIFDVNIPVIVSVMRSAEQKIIPFWLPGSGFVKTDLKMKNEQTTYEVWQKSFNSGTVGLGINGFENYPLHYFVSVAPQKVNDQPELSNFFPSGQYVGTLDNGAFIYHDWDELVLSDVPESMIGQKLLTTVRGRGVESQLTGAFRTTDYPSSSMPDQIMLTWSSDPETGIDIQWRTDNTISHDTVRYRAIGSSQEFTSVAGKYVMDDRVLLNDRSVNRYTARLRDLKPGTRYEYLVIPQEKYQENQTFSTPSADSDFSFIWFGDTHHSPKFGELIRAAEKRHPETAFYSIAGDIVSDGLFRNQWDEIFNYSEEVICRKPLMVVPGNHDNRAGLGALMFRELFSYPINGPEGVEKEQTYSFKYKNALFLMIDATSPIDAQTNWIEDQLSGTDATWKFAMFHFPPYSSEGGYPEIRQKWCTLFDKYHVDMVMSGHVHNYLRTKPMKDGKPVLSPSEGTVYLVSIGIPDNDPQAGLPFAAKQVSGEMLYQKVLISGNRLDYKVMNLDGVVRDQLTITK
ncbi:MAG: metallophosphoesterase family protein [Bacteroidales bacterium]|nr:metallophosphoesterase family protein [Bacteroidales bacterium]